MATLKGTKICKISAPFLYDDLLYITDDEGNTYKMNTKIILQMVNDFNFTTEEKKTHTHIIRADYNPTNEKQ